VLPFLRVVFFAGLSNPPLRGGQACCVCRVAKDMTPESRCD
jgi:hypothetical protein